MKKLFILFSIIGFFSCQAQLSPQSKKVTSKFFPEIELKINTPAFQKKKGYTSYKELIAFLSLQMDNYPDLSSLKYIGTSQKGKQIPMLVLSNHESKDDKVKVWIQGGLHGNEMASTESVLYLIDQLLNNKKYAHLLDRLDVAFVPMANIDGYEKQDRYAANGLDLNRDQTKLNIHESVFLKQAFSNYNAEVALDIHEYKPYRKDFAQFSTFGISSIYDAMFLYSGNLNVPKSLRDYTKERFVTAAQKVLDENQISHHEYISTRKYLGDIHFNQGSENSRSSATSYALTNCISSLIEIRGVGLGRTSFKRRVNSSFLIAITYLETAYDHLEEVKKELSDAEKSRGDAAVKTKKHIFKDIIQTIDLDKNQKISLEVTIHDALQLTPTLERKRPTAYIILKEELEAIKKLGVLGLDIEFLETDKEVEVESYLVVDYKKAQVKYEGVRIQTVRTEIQNLKMVFPKGSAVVYLDQSKANLAIEVLEPEVRNGFISFNVIQAQGLARLPIYRYLKTDPI